MILYRKLTKKHNILKIKMIYFICFSLMLKIRSYSPILSFSFVDS